MNRNIKQNLLKINKEFNYKHYLKELHSNVFEIKLKLIIVKLFMFE